MASPASIPIPQFAPELLSFIQSIWTDESAIQSASDVYMRYGDSGVSGVLNTWKNADEYALGLQTIMHNQHSDCSVLRQSDSWERDQTKIYNTFNNIRAQATNPPTTVDPDTSLFLNDDFFHFTNNHCKTPARERIYVHLKPPISKTGVNVMTQLVALFASTPGLSSAKICSPFATDRLDSIVIYLTDAHAVKKILQVLQDPGMSSCFAPGLPHVVEKVMEGVGRAQEPPKTAPKYDADGVSKHPLRAQPQLQNGSVKTENTSFGALHSELLWTGLKKWRNKGRPGNQANSSAVPPELLDEIKAAYGRANIDTMNPTQFDRAKIENRYQQKMNDKLLYDGLSKMFE